jgi:hypothetical protein
MYWSGRSGRRCRPNRPIAPSSSAWRRCPRRRRRTRACSGRGRRNRRGSCRRSRSRAWHPCRPACRCRGAPVRSPRGPARASGSARRHRSTWSRRWERPGERRRRRRRVGWVVMVEAPAARCPWSSNGPAPTLTTIESKRRSLRPSVFCIWRPLGWAILRSGMRSVAAPAGGRRPRAAPRRPQQRPTPAPSS